MASSRTLPETLATTRAGWHRVAEHVLSPARHAVTGRIGLRPAPGGYCTPPFGADGRVVAVDGVELVDRPGTGPERRAGLTTLREAAAFVGVEPGAPAGVYTPSTPLLLDAPLDIDPTAAAVLADWFALGSDALTRFAAGIATGSTTGNAAGSAADEPSEAQLWPEHFDLAIDAAGVNYGVSPGDEHVPVPYVYVGPHQHAPPGDPFFTMPFGAVRTIHQTPSADEALAFFREGRARAQRIPRQRSGS